MGILNFTKDKEFAQVHIVSQCQDHDHSQDALASGPKLLLLNQIVPELQESNGEGEREGEKEEQDGTKYERFFEADSDYTYVVTQTAILTI